MAANLTHTLFYLLETPYHLRVATDDGRERWIAKYKLATFRVVDDCDVTVAFKPKFVCDTLDLGPPPKLTDRRCPRCKRTFGAKANYRYCDPCKSTDAWVFANQSFDR